MYKAEQHIQEAVAFFIRLKYPNALFTIAPAGQRRGSKLQRIIAGKEAKRMGYRKGTSDVFIVKKTKEFSGLFLELKTESGKLTHDQKVFMDIASKEGFCCLVGYGYEDSIKKIDGYMQHANL